MSNTPHGVRLVTVAGTSALVGLMFGIVATISSTPPPKVETKVIRVPEYITKEVEGPKEYVPVPYPESCEDLTDKSIYLKRALDGYFKPMEQAQLAIERELMPAALLGEIQKLNVANIKVHHLIDDASWTVYRTHQLRSDIETSYQECMADVEKGRQGNDDYEAGDGQQTPKSTLDDLYFRRG